jgi:hypothetical protein
MNQQRNVRSSQRRRSGSGGANRPAGVDLWAQPGELPELEPIPVPHDVSAMLRSLGDPPLYNAGNAAKSFGAVAERSAQVALALAALANVLEVDE